MPIVLIDYRAHRQGGWDNCWFRAALDGLAFKRPGDLADLVAAGDGGAFVVTFPGRGPHEVMPEPRGDALYATAVEVAADRELGGARTARVLSYGEGIELLTGRGRTGYSNGTGAGFAPLTVLWSRRDWLVSRLTAATNERKLMVLGGSDGHWTAPKVGWVPPRHCYALLAFDPRTLTARVRDPYGRDDGIPAERKRPDFGPGESWVTLDELEGSWCGLTIEND